MGLFDFVKDIGEKLFDRDDKAAEKIKDRIETNNPGLSKVDVEYDDGVVTLSGDAADREALEKAVLIAGNVKGVSEVKTSGIDLPAANERVEYYTIEHGDTLSKIAKRYYGDPMKYPRIFEANREVIKDPDLIYPGQKVRIPLD